MSRLLTTGVLQQARNLSQKQYALSFDGIDDYVEIPYSTGTNDFSLEVEVLLKNDNNQWIINNRTESTSIGWQFVVYLGVLSFYINAQLVISLPMPSFFHYNNYKFIYEDLSVLKVYINNVLFDTVSAPSINNGGNYTHVGGAIWHNNLFSSCSIKKIIINSSTDYEADFSTGFGNILYDKTPNANHGTIYGATWVEI